MNNYQLPIMVFLWCASLYISWNGWEKIFADYQKRKEDKIKHPVKVDWRRLCSEQNMIHKWINIRWRDNGELTEVNACETCGYIPSKNLMVNEKMLPSMGTWHRHNRNQTEAKDAWVLEESEVVKDLMSDVLEKPSAQALAALYQRGVLFTDRLNDHLDQAEKDFFEKEKQRENQ